VFKTLVSFNTKDEFGTVTDKSLSPLRGGDDVLWGKNQTAAELPAPKVKFELFGAEN
jgi:hypothetical protein